jgi:hypothetical protein
MENLIIALRERFCRFQLSNIRQRESIMPNNRTVGFVHLVVGLLWLAAMPVFLWFMVSMEGRAEPARPDSAAWRLWRATEALLIEPQWLAYLLSFLLFGTSVLGAAFVETGIGSLLGTAHARKWASTIAASGIVFCGIGFIFHWALFMPVVNASQNPAVLRASEDLNLALPIALGVGFVSTVVASLASLGARWQIISPGTVPKQT